MRKAAAFLLMLLFAFPILLAAQDEGDDPDFETDWEDYMDELYVAGDQTFQISLGVIFPTVFLNNGEEIKHNINPPVGGTGTLAFNYYMTSKFYLGGEISGVFAPTLGKNTLFLIPLGVRAGYQFIAGPFEFPLTVAVGMAWHTFLDLGYYGFYLKGGASVYIRPLHSWSFGITTNWYWLPEWTNDKSKDVDGNFIDLMLSVRYHF